jgi:16S rRNA (guanine(527)-N(7))-methyltransferase RsmG
MINGALGLLDEQGIAVPRDAVERLDQYHALIREWNPVVSLVSEGDAADGLVAHSVDSLSLAPYVARIADGGLLLDIGSGGGFPAIPLKLVLPDLRVTLVERSEKKVGFLRKICGALQLTEVALRLGSFPQAVTDLEEVSAVTARAVEKPGKVFGEIVRRLSPKGVFLCQFAEIPGLDRSMFHVEHVRDEWSAQGLRRGNLHLIQRSTWNRATPSGPSA